jgi:hypothetical protein
LTQFGSVIWVRQGWYGCEIALSSSTSCAPAAVNYTLMTAEQLAAEVSR